MGDPYRKQQVKNAQKRREIAIREASQPRLPVRASFAETKVALMPEPGTQYSPGEQLAIMADHDCMRVVRDGYEHVGRVEGELAARLRDFFATDGGTNVIQVKVTDVAALSGVAHAEVVQPN